LKSDYLQANMLNVTYSKQLS